MSGFHLNPLHFKRSLGLTPSDRSSQNLLRPPSIRTPATVHRAHLARPRLRRTNAPHWSMGHVGSLNYARPKWHHGGPLGHRWPIASSGFESPGDLFLSPPLPEVPSE